MNVIAVTLTWTEVRAAALVGIDRNIRTMAEDRHRGGGQPMRDGWTDHVCGSLAETAAAKALGKYPTRTARDTDGDVGTYQVRSTLVHSSLIVYEYDSDDAPYILALHSQEPSRNGWAVTLVGWMLGREAKQPHWQREGKRKATAYWVPAVALHPMNELPMEAMR